MSQTQNALKDSLTYLNDIENFTAGMSQSEFLVDRKTQLAVIRAFEVVGEALKRVPQELLETQPTVNWRAVKGFRDVLIHQYDNIDLVIVWDAVQRVTQVQVAVRLILDNLAENTDETL